MDSLMRSSRFYYVLVDRAGNIQQANDFFQKQFAQYLGELTGHPFAEILLVGDGEKFEQAFQLCISDPGSIVPASLQILLSSGFPQTIHWELSAHLDESGATTAVQLIGQGSSSIVTTDDLPGTEQSSHDNYLARLINSVSDIIISQDRNFRVISWNKAAEIAYGYSAGEMVGRQVKEVMHFEYEGITRPRFFELLEENGEWHGEAYVVNRHGRAITLLASITKIRNAKGETTGYVSISKDITEKRKMEERLEKSELFYRNLFANSLDGVLITDDRGIIRFASSSITPILGYTEADVMDKNIFNYVHIEDRPLAVMAFMDEMAGNLTEKFISLRLLKKTGEWVWCFIRGHNLTQNKYISGVVIYFHDDTLRRGTEAALIESEQRFRYQATILANVTDVIMTTDAIGTVTSWNKVIEKVSGIKEEDAIGRPIREIFPTDHSPFTLEEVSATLKKDGIWSGEVSFKDAEGQTVYLLHTVSTLYNEEGSYIGYLGVGKDITERKKAEEHLRDSEQFFRDMSYYSFDGTVLTDEKGVIKYCGPSIHRISGYEPWQLIGKNVFEFIHPQDIPAATEGFLKELNKASEVDYMLLRLRHMNGEWVWCSVRTHNLLRKSGLNAMVVYFTNDTRRKEAEDRLRESEENFRTLIHNLKQGVLLMDKNASITIFNQAVVNMFGWNEEELLGRNLFTIPLQAVYEDGTYFPPEEFPVRIGFDSKKPVHDVVMGFIHPVTNERVWTLTNIQPLLDNEGEIISVICSVTDITEQKRLTQELFEQEVHKQKLLTQATIDGQEKERMLMGKELHDNINQHLTTTRLYLEVASEKATGDVQEMIQLSHKTLANIIYEIRQLSQSLVPPTLGDIGLAESIQELCESLKKAHAFSVDFYHPFFREEGLAANLKLMLYRITQEQVNNIVRHAHAAHLHIKLQSDAEYIFLTISDDGIGFDPSHYKKGMGFSNIITRADLFNGKVEIETSPGNGCQLSVIIPLESAMETSN